MQQRLKEDPDLRACLRELSEQAVILADMERTQDAVGEKATSLQTTQVGSEPGSRQGSLRWRNLLPIAALIALSAIVLQGMFGKENAPQLSISQLSSACQLFGVQGAVKDDLEVGMPIVAGETIESRSCDSWLQLKLGDHSRITLSGHSHLQHLEHAGKILSLRLRNGSMWGEYHDEPDIHRIKILTSSALIELHQAQFDLHTEPFFSRLRVNRGEARVTRLVDNARQSVSEGEQIEITLDLEDAFVTTEQSQPVTAWDCHALEGPDIGLGKIMPSTQNGFANIKAVPLKWPIAKEKHIMLHAVAVSVARSHPQPVLLQPGSRLRYYISYDRPERVRFGFSTQRMRGVYAGKFETDVQPKQIGQVGEIQQIDLSLDAFWPLNPKLSSAPEGLEVSDVYALTIHRDAGLKVHRIEILPPEQALD